MARGLAGGILIGLGAVLLLWSIGRIAGVSGIASGAIEGVRGDRAWRLAFLAGMMLAGAIALQFLPAPPRVLTGPAPLLLAAVATFMGFAMATTYFVRHVIVTVSLT